MMVSNQIDDALAYISSETSRDEWLKILMAIKSELHECGYDIAKNWSKKSDMFNRNDFDSTWKSIKLEGGITIATLFKIAKDYGYAPDSNISCVKSNDVSSVVGIWNSASIDNIELHNYWTLDKTVFSN